MTTLTLNLHPAQEVIRASTARFKVVAAGRRFGKTVLAVIMCIIEGLREKNDRGVPLDTDSEVVYIGVTLEQARRNAWHLLKDYARPVTMAVHENTALLTLANGVRIRLLGMDNPDAARGMKIRFAILDEYADMPENVWLEIIRPALMDVEGGALFIGTPKGKNHFYELFTDALVKPDSPDGTNSWGDWEAFNFASSDNPTIKSSELAGMAHGYTRGSEYLHRQEIQAKFVSRSGDIFSESDFIIDAQEPTDGEWVVVADLAGFEAETFGAKELRRRDESAIVTCKVSTDGWWVKRIRHGKWDVRQTALHLIQDAFEVKAPSIGIEKGVLAQAVEPYLREYMSRYNRWVNLYPLTHGNRNKQQRITWSLEGRCKKGLVKLNPGPWNAVLIDQATDFPSRKSRDDLLDALSYVDQIASPLFFDFDLLPAEDNYQPLDAVSGY